MTGKSVSLVLACSLLLAGCSSLGDLIYGESDGPPLPGKRESVLKSSDPLAVETTSGGVAIPGSRNGGWSQPGGNPANAPVHLALGGALRPIWRADAGTGSTTSGRLTANPVIAAGKVFTIDTRAQVTAVSAANGRRLWRASLVPKGESSTEGYGGAVAYDNGRVFATTGFGTVVALDATNGGKLWEKQLGSPVRSAPTAAAGKVFALTVDNRLFALSQSDGEIAWDFRRFAESAGVLGSTSPAVYGGKVVAPYSSGEIIAFDIASGKALWGDSFTRTGTRSAMAKLSAIAARPAIENGVVFVVSHSGRMGAISLSKGSRLWARNIAGTQTPWPAGNSVFVVSLSGKLMALDRKTGKIRWLTNLNAAPASAKRKKAPGAEWAGPVLAGGRLLLVSSTGYLVMVNPQTGAIAATRKLGGRYLIPPVVANGTLYLLSNSAKLTALR